MIILLQNIWFLKEFLACNDCFGLLSKIKKGSGASIWWTFSARFFHKNVPYLILYQWTKFQCYILFLSQDTNKMLLSSYLENDDIMNFKIFLGSISKAMADMEKKTGWNMKIGISREWKELLDEIKKHFSEFLKGYHLVKNKKQIKIIIFIKFSFFHQMIALQKLWKMLFTSSK